MPVPALMRDWPALNSAVLALFAIVPGARFSAGERSVHVPALKGSLDCSAFLRSLVVFGGGGGGGGAAPVTSVHHATPSPTN